MSTAVIAQRQKAPICQAPEYVFHRVALLRQSDSVSCWMTAFGMCRDTRPDCACCERITEPGGIASFLCEHLFGGRQICLERVMNVSEDGLLHFNEKAQTVSH